MSVMRADPGRELAVEGAAEIRVPIAGERPPLGDDQRHALLFETANRGRLGARRGECAREERELRQRVPALAQRVEPGQLGREQDLSPRLGAALDWIERSTE